MLAPIDYDKIQVGDLVYFQKDENCSSVVPGVYLVVEKRDAELSHGNSQTIFVDRNYTNILRSFSGNCEFVRTKTVRWLRKI